MNKEELDSNNLHSRINNVCDECGREANRLTCLKRYGKEPDQAKFLVSTFHKGKCDFCGKETDITQVRDYFYPDFGLINPYENPTNMKYQKIRKRKTGSWTCQKCGSFYSRSNLYCKNCYPDYETNFWTKIKEFFNI